MRKILHLITIRLYAEGFILCALFGGHYLLYVMNHKCSLLVLQNDLTQGNPTFLRSHLFITTASMNSIKAFSPAEQLKKKRGCVKMRNVGFL